MFAEQCDYFFRSVLPFWMLAEEQVVPNNVRIGFQQSPMYGDIKLGILLMLVHLFGRKGDVLMGRLKHQVQ